LYLHANSLKIFVIQYLLVFNQKSDILLNLKWFSCWGKSLVGLSESVKQNLLEVPPDVLLGEGAVVQHLGVIQCGHCRVTPAQGPGVDGEPVLAVDVRPGEEGEVRLEVVAGSDVLDGVEDLRWVPRRFLVKKVAAGDTEDLQVSIVGGSECIQVRILAGKTSVGRHVHQHHHLPAVLGQGDVPRPVEERHLVVVEAALALPAGGHGQAQQAAGQQGQ